VLPGVARWHARHWWRDLRRARRAAASSQRSANADEAMLAEWVDAEAVKEALERVLEHDLVILR
jgi:predicted alpha/beta hydrolase family esterase